MFNQSNIETKKCEWTTEYTYIRYVYCPACGNEKCVYISTNKLSSFYHCKKGKACCHVLNTPFKDQKPTIIIFRGDGTKFLVKKTSLDYENEKQSFFEEISPSVTINHNRT